MAKKKAREHVALECTVCKERNYYTEKNKTNTTTRLELNKFCSRCRKSTPHKESK
ncbi:MAG TPA: 50S ribosomal protein L33 [Candidatus Saccharimonadales bacterium]|nr:50S ribosomal protein L33 [Candidatus Saccharimonadales bacterium]